MSALALPPRWLIPSSSLILGDVLRRDTHTLTRRATLNGNPVLCKVL